jgi:hypothetical protein
LGQDKVLLETPMLKLMLATMLLLVCNVASFANDIPIFEYLRLKHWSVGQEFQKNNFESCYIGRIDDTNPVRIEFGRSISGKAFLYVFAIEKLIGENESDLAGKVWFDGKTSYSFSNVPAVDMVSVSGGKFAKLNLGKGKIEEFAKSKVLELEFSKGRTRHSLEGAGDAISKLDACMDDGLTKIFELPPEPLPYPTPLNWFEGVSTSAKAERFIATQLPKVDKQPEVYFAYVKTDLDNYDIRIRPLSDRAGLASSLDASDPNVKQSEAKFFFGIGKMLSTKPLFSAQVLHHINGSVDIKKLSISELLFFGNPVSSLAIRIDGQNPGIELPLTLNWETRLGVGSIIHNETSIVPVPLSPPVILREADLAGSYYVRGKNPDGSYYYGNVEVKLEQLFALRFTWTWPNGKTETAMVVKTGEQLTVAESGPNFGDSYAIGKDGNLRGTFDKGKGSEILIRKF